MMTFFDSMASVKFIKMLFHDFRLTLLRKMFGTKYFSKYGMA